MAFKMQFLVQPCLALYEELSASVRPKSRLTMTAWVLNSCAGVKYYDPERFARLLDRDVVAYEQLALKQGHYVIGLLGSFFTTFRFKHAAREIALRRLWELMTSADKVNTVQFVRGLNFGAICGGWGPDRWEAVGQLIRRIDLERVAETKQMVGLLFQVQLIAITRYVGGAGQEVLFSIGVVFNACCVFKNWVKRRYALLS